MVRADARWGCESSSGGTSPSHTIRGMAAGLRSNCVGRCHVPGRRATVVRAIQMIVKIRMPIGEIRRAAHVGIEWHLNNMVGQRGTTPYGGLNQAGWEGNISGAIGECAVALWAGIPWDGNIEGHEASHHGERPHDVGKYEVRASWHSSAHLVLRPSRDDGKERSPYILVTLEALPVAKLRGWMWGGLVKQQEWWREDKSGWWMPQPALIPLPREPKIKPEGTPSYVAD